MRFSTINNIQKQVSRENKKEARKSKSVVFFGHQNWNLVVNIMMGIQMSVQSAASSQRLTGQVNRVGRSFSVTPQPARAVFDRRDVES